jgi:hypothetical protein
VTLAERLFLVYTFITELNMRLGKGELARMMFGRAAKSSLANR